ncbi:AMP-dependent synthetase and ligase [Colletotrichum tofieldiae]|nr:AMP-dependent synthetase and ligase [Colletotrichum tofieldiae]GKT71125.1 AMP-dependent synthetase and ligase [Colletotrichum tofieldiae]GKT93956.1 AMP-dependent synthetase and ligase [Colletotrichum tofieldiae]
MSFGGTLAFELAKRFERMGKRVVFAGALDTPPNIAFLGSSGFLRFLLLDLLGVRSVLSPSDIHDLKSNLRMKPQEHFIELLFEKHGARLLEAGLTPARIEAWQNVLDGVIEMSLKYEAEGATETLDVFWAGPVVQWGFTEEEWSSSIHKWDGCVKSLKYHRVKGDHLTLTSSEHIDDFQVVLNNALRCRGI